MRSLLKLSPKALCAFLLGPFILMPMVSMFLLVSGHRVAMTVVSDVVNNVVTALWMILLWTWSERIAAHLAENTPSRLLYIKSHIVGSAVYLVLFQIHWHLNWWGVVEPQVWEFLVIFPLHIYVTVSLLRIAYIISVHLISLEDPPAPRFGSKWGTFLMFLFLPLGVLNLQPRIQKILLAQPENPS